MSEPTTVHWLGWPHAPAPIAAIRRAGAGAIVIDDQGRRVPFGPLQFAVQLLRGLWLRALDLGCAAIAALSCARTSPPHAAAPGAGPTVLLLPVLPDLSHTFVYREVLAMLRQRPDWRVFVLQHNAAAPVHDEARQLLVHAQFLVRDGITERAWRVLRWLLRPAGRELFSLYRSQPGGSVHDLLGKNPLRDARHPGNAFALADQLRRQLGGSAPRHVHVYSSTYAANVAMGASHLLGCPFSISSYVDFEFAYDHQLLAEKMARATFFRVVTEFCAARLRERLSLPADDQRVMVLLLGLDLANWQQPCQPSGAGILISAARLVEKKGLRFVPAALAELRRSGIAFRWHVIGDGPQLPALRDECARLGVADAVQFFGPKDNSAVRDELRRADIALLPCVVAADGERDGIPIFLCEAMALGVPVVTTAVSGIPEVVRDGETGVLCAPGDSAALADALAALLRDATRAATLGRAGRALVHHELDVDRLTTRLVARIER